MTNTENKSLSLLHALQKSGKDSLLGIIILSLITFALHAHEAKEDKEYKISHEVLNQYISSKNTLDDKVIRNCLTSKKTSRINSNERTRKRQDLVKLVQDNRNNIPSSAYFMAAKFTRFDDAQAFQNFCSMSSKDLLRLQGKLTDWQSELQDALGI